MARLFPTTHDIEGGAVVVIEDNDGLLHSGLVFTVDDEPQRLLHLWWHLKPLVDAVPDDMFWVPSGLRRVQAEAVATMASKIAERYHESGVEYGLSVEGIEILDDGTIMLDGGVGLTCASFVHFVFDSVQLTPIVISSYECLPPERVEEDERVQRHLVGLLRADRRTCRHAERVAREIGRPRIRPEDIAGVSSLGERPVDRVRADQVGKEIREQLSRLSG